MLQHFNTSAFNFQVPPIVNDASRDIDGNIPRGAQLTSTLSPIATHLTSKVSAFACSHLAVKKIAEAFCHGRLDGSISNVARTFTPRTSTGVLCKAW